MEKSVNVFWSYLSLEKKSPDLQEIDCPKVGLNRNSFVHPHEENLSYSHKFLLANMQLHTVDQLVLTTAFPRLWVFKSPAALRLYADGEIVLTKAAAHTIILMKT